MNMHKEKKTQFERAIFYSWSCYVEHRCKYCYMSGLPRDREVKERVRSFGSILAETIICKKCNWHFGSLTGGIGAFPMPKIIDLVKKISIIMEEKVWVNIGVLPLPILKKLQPYIQGVIGTVEVLDPKLHEEMCPSKPLAGAEVLFNNATKLGVRKAMTLIIGLGEKFENDFPLFKDFVNKHGIERVQLYAFNPQKGTELEKLPPPTKEYHAKWVKSIREEFPDMVISTGAWLDRVETLKGVLEAGADYMTKFPALRKFGKDIAFDFEKQAELAGRDFIGTVTKLPDVDWDAEVDKLDFDEELKADIKKKLQIYVKNMK
jgi:biotin synthase-like enzyme